MKSPKKKPAKKSNKSKTAGGSSVIKKTTPKKISAVRSKTAKAKLISSKNTGGKQILNENLRLRTQLKQKERELDIEAALEKVRARTMAMQRSDELSEVAVLLFQQVKSFGFASWGCGFNIWEKDEKVCTSYFTDNAGNLVAPFRIPLTEDPIFIRFYESRQKGEDFWTEEISGEQEIEHYKYLCSLPVVGEMLKATLVAGIPFPTFQIDHGVNFSRGNLLFITYEPVPEAHDIFKRFGKVFEQTYTRFLDLQKAEAQAREAHIEASLERIRSRSMAMHKSEELLQVITVVSEQLAHLKFKFNTVSFAINNQEHDYKFWFAAMGSPTPTYIQVPYINNPMFDRVKDALATGASFYSDILTPEENRQWHEHVFANAEIPFLSDETKEYVLNSGYARSVAITPSIMLVISNYAGRPYTDADNDIIRRFAVVFEQSYTRFLDLQKVEAQAKESLIQLALERIRARTMAMQRSDELMEAAYLLFQQVQALGIPVWSCGYNIWESGEEFCTGWMSTLGVVQPSFRIPLTESPTFIRMRESRLKGEPFFIEEVGPEALSEHYRYMFSLPDFNKIATAQLHDGLILPTSQINNVFNFKHGNIIFISSEPVPESWNIFERLTAVFEQTYTRFLDLKKAEAQARDAEIELSLERIRAKAMSIRKSAELLDVIHKVFEEWKKLGLELYECNINLLDRTTRAWTNWGTGIGEATLPKSYQLPYFEHPFLRQIYDDTINNVSWRTIVVEGEDYKSFVQRLFTETGFRNSPTEYQDALRSIDKIYSTQAYMEYGSLDVVTREPLPETTGDILKRFSKVFEQAYTRYLDLVQAETQTREAQIEAALEKVRSRSLAMHRSDELREVVKTVFDKLDELNFVLEDGAVGILIFKENTKNHTQWMADPGHSYATPFEVPYSDHSLPKDLIDARGNDSEFFSKIYPTEEKNEYFKYLFVHSIEYKNLPDEVKALILGSTEYGISVAFAKNSAIAVPTNRGRLLNESEKEILKRFVRVFEQAYTRFLDLQKAEAQAKEALIEAALEKIRSRSLAMHRSTELKEVVVTMFRKLSELNVLVFSVAIQIFDEKTMNSVFWVGNDLQDDPPVVNLPYDEKMMNENNELKDSWHAFLSGESIINKEYSLEQKDRYFDYVFANNDFTAIQERGRQFIRQGKSHIICLFVEKNSALFADSWNGQYYGEEQIKVLKRAAKVFEQAYIRFLDLQKAEAQAREAQIEASLERVRSKTMAMHKSDDILEVVKTMCEQFTKLNFDFHVVNIGTDFRNPEHDLHLWIYSLDAGKIYPEQIRIPYIDTTLLIRLKEAVDTEVDFFTITLTKGDKDTFYQHLFDHTIVGGLIPEDRKKFLLDQAIYSSSFYILKHTMVIVINYAGKPFPDEHNDILRRFGNVFEQSYTRFLDLQKAEGQAREAQIEASLERVRAKTMAMHSSDDIGAATTVMFNELRKLGIEAMRFGVLVIHENKTMEVWTSSAEKDGETNRGAGLLDMTMHPMLSNGFECWKRGDEMFQYTLQGDDLKDYYRAVSRSVTYAANFQIENLPTHTATIVFFNEGGLYTFSLHPHNSSMQQLMQRFTSAFSLTFRRYQDLKHAEAQAREATIEASLERVRAKAMAMHSTADLTTTISTIFTELRNLGIKPLRFGLGIIQRGTRYASLYSASVSDDGGDLQLVGSVYLKDHPILTTIYDRWHNKEETYFPVLKGELLRSYYEKLRPDFQTPDWHADYEQYGQFYYFEEGSLYSWSEQPVQPSEVPIFKRFTSVLALTYKRYYELQQSENNAREAVRRASLDRVRAEIASMRTTSDLERITPLIWKELTILEVPFVRCGVFIMDEENQFIHTFLSTPDGKAIAALHLPFNSTGRVGEILNHWKRRENYIQHWDESAFAELADQFLAQGAIASKDQYMNTVPAGGVHLHCLLFPQGMFYVGNKAVFAEEDIQLIRSLADAFSSAYARYEDFNKLESAKQQVDKTLVDLKQTQQQLVQSEKMASLGELTAGIAHEIQNPLNFVNNFSDVSNELLQEMADEIEKGNVEAARTIALDVKQNLEKILHHGKRADGIVKGMLQHSRSSSGAKEPTDINVLADEYLRLAYHGLRAKDKFFDATMKTDFDPGIGTINVVPQDFGRVILNLITNAFYAVSEKKKRQEGFEPIITVTTKKNEEEVLISVRDNGLGIPHKVLEKIFQPFFTTKPTGQGTGLGLSLSYDIVKAHGGELKVETEEGVGTEFTICIPLV